MADAPDTLAEMDAAFERSRELADARRRRPSRLGRPSRLRIAALGALLAAAVTGAGFSLAAADSDPSQSGARSVRVNLGSGAAVVPAGCPIPSRFRSAFAEASLKTGVPLSLLAAVAWEESAMDAGARSSAGALGLMQVMPATAREVGYGARRPASNVLAGATYLERLLERYGSDLALALAAYNAGPGAVEKSGGAPTGAVLQYAADVQRRAARLGVCDAV